MDDEYAPEFVAMHEAGHGVAAAVLGFDLDKLEIRERWKGFDEQPALGGSFAYAKSADPVAIMAYCLAGAVAESTVSPDGFARGTCDQDLASVTRVAAEAALRGWGPPEETIPHAMAIARQIVTENRNAICRVAAALLDRRELSGQEVVAMAGEAEDEKPGGGSPAELGGFY